MNRQGMKIVLRNLRDTYNALAINRKLEMHERMIAQEVVKDRIEELGR